MTVIRLVEAAGEFCVARTDPGIPALRAQVREALIRDEHLAVQRQGTKGLSVSFLDEWLGPLIVEFGLERIRARISFDPPLEAFLAKQLERSRRLRTPG